MLRELNFNLTGKRHNAKNVFMDTDDFTFKQKYSADEYVNIYTRLKIKMRYLLHCYLFYVYKKIKI